MLLVLRSLWEPTLETVSVGGGTIPAKTRFSVNLSEETSVTVTLSIDSDSVSATLVEND